MKTTFVTQMRKTARRLATLAAAVALWPVAALQAQESTAADSLLPGQATVQVVGAERADSTKPGMRVYTFPIREDIMPSAQRLTGRCLKEAQEMSADLVVIQMNTYGGLADVADSIRTMVLNCPVPVWVWIDNQAVSAGALIAIAADSIYMRPGGSIGAASVVNQSGELVPDKYQSFMRAMMRATAESHGKVADHIAANGDTVWRWHRDPAIAEQMVGRTLADSTTIKVLTLTSDEALAAHYAEGRASTLEGVLQQGGISDYTLEEFKPSSLDRFMGWLMNPAVQGVFIMLIIGGIYFELQTPGIGFPLMVAVAGALGYFAPLYVEGIARNWELLLFVAGLILIGVEIFVLPGFGVAGVAGILAVVLGLTFAAIDNDLFRYVPSGQLSLASVLSPLSVVIIACTVAFILAIWLGRRFLTGRSRLRERVVLTSEMDPLAGYVGRDPYPELVGREGVVSAVLRPSGKVLIDGHYYDAVAEDGFFVDKSSLVRVVRAEGGVLYCRSENDHTASSLPDSRA